MAYDPLINCRGVYTYLTASVELPQVRKAAEEASIFFIDNILELHDQVGSYLAKMSGAEYGMVTSGPPAPSCGHGRPASPAPTRTKIYQLPDLTGMKSEVIMMGGRSAFDSCNRLCRRQARGQSKGVDDLGCFAINSKTAMIYIDSGQRDDDTIKKNTRHFQYRRRAHARGRSQPEFHPCENFSRFAKLGVDMYCFSGGNWSQCAARKTPAFCSAAKTSSERPRATTALRGKARSAVR